MEYELNQVKSKNKINHLFSLAGNALKDCLNINPHLAEAFALEGTIYLIQSQITNDPLIKRSQLEKASLSLIKGIGLNGNLKHHYQPYLNMIEHR